MGRLIQTLRPGPLDIVDDVHGEIDALDFLVDRPGYGPAGRHCDDRNLDIVGDLGSAEGARQEVIEPPVDVCPRRRRWSPGQFGAFWRALRHYGPHPGRT
jgi:hypothetical protein